MVLGSWFLVLGSWWREAWRSAAGITAALLVTLALVVGADFAAAADTSGVTTVKVLVADEKADSGDEKYEQMRLDALTKAAAKRVRKRLETARIKNFTIETEKPRTIRVSARGDVPHALLAGIVVPQGRFELRPAESVGRHWTKMSSRLPSGVELRQEKASLSAGDAFVWSKSRRKLQEAAAKAEVDGLDVEVYPHAGGWRTLALGQPVATQEDVSRVKIRQGKTGDVYVRLQFDRQVSAAHLPARTRRTWAVVLDGEVVATFQRLDANFGDALSITSPEHLGSKKRRHMWAQQVAGRLAAFMSVPLVEVPQD